MKFEKELYMAKNCGNCNWCAENGLDLVCVNNESEYVADFVDVNHSCDAWEGNEEEEDECE